MEEIGTRIAKMRKEKKLTQVKLAEKLSISDKAVSKWESGKGVPCLEMLQALSDIFDCSLDYLVKGEKEGQEDKEEDKPNYSTKPLTKEDFKEEVVELKAINEATKADIKKIKGNLIYRDKDKYFYAPRLGNCMLVNESTRKDIDFKDKRYAVGNYFIDQVRIFALTSRPSLIIKDFDCLYDEDSFMVSLDVTKTYKKYTCPLLQNELDDFNTYASYICCNSANKFLDVIEQIYRSRSNGTVNMRPIYVFMKDIQGIDLSRLATLLITARSRKINFVIAVDKEQDVPEIRAYFDLIIFSTDHKINKIYETICGIPMLVRDYDDYSPIK